TEPPEMAPLRERLELGVACQLHLEEGWERLRLTYMSPGRTMFLFQHGSRGRGTISMTARMLQRLSEAGRLRAAERVPLIDRATARARRQLAGSLTPGAATPAGANMQAG
ncbi:MAG: DUF1631 domain-containing protein, partial [Pseudomonadota bacterium]|nr:DUF1631 domain-containing protein [Pseudomonadota bacterium]